VTWRWTGYNMIILLAGLQTIPQQLYEAAEIDGANRWEKFRYVTLPQPQAGHVVRRRTIDDRDVQTVR